MVHPDNGPALPAVDEQLLTGLKNLKHCFVLSDPRKKDNPICYASDAFYEMTGYPPEEVIGSNCRFLQGAETSRRAVTEIRDAVREERPCQVLLLNYKKTGEKFWNLFYMSPIVDPISGKVINYMGVQTEIPEDTAMELAASIESLPSETSGAAAEVLSAEHVACNLQGTLQGLLRDKAEQEQQSAAEVFSVAQSMPASPLDALTINTSLLLPLTEIQQSFVLSDPNQADCPIVYASPLFLAMSGYAREEVVGRNCRFMQGEMTDQAEVAKVREAMEAEKPVTVRLLNYRKCGTPFWNSLHVCPVRNAEGKVAFYCGVQLDVSAVAAGEGGLPERVGMKERVAHMGATGAVRVAVRSLHGGKGGHSAPICGLRRTAS
mmetsp:Transcript_56620/g.178963  ORF Transcript_56620/g.178963 Transcript_56620/m.178963 type:complete len:377 (-) Transcript_56620:197-1327(-)